MSERSDNIFLRDVTIHFKAHYAINIARLRGDRWRQDIRSICGKNQSYSGACSDSDDRDHKLRSSLPPTLLTKIKSNSWFGTFRFA